MSKNTKRLVAAWLVVLGMSVAGFGDILNPSANGYAYGTPPSTIDYSVQAGPTVTYDFAGLASNGESLRAIFKFDISAYTTAVGSAKLDLYLAADGLGRAADLYSIYTANSGYPFGTQVVAHDYAYPGQPATLIGQAWGANAALGQYNLDVTDAVNAAIAAGKTYVGFLIKAADETTTGANAYYYIRSTTNTSGNTPTLTIVPEPATIGVLLVGGLLAIARRKR